MKRGRRENEVSPAERCCDCMKKANKECAYKRCRSCCVAAMRRLGYHCVPHMKDTDRRPAKNRLFSPRHSLVLLLLCQNTAFLFHTHRRRPCACKLCPSCVNCQEPAWRKRQSARSPDAVSSDTVADCHASNGFVFSPSLTKGVSAHTN